MPDDDPMPEAVTAWESEHGRTWGEPCTIPGCRGHAHQPPAETITTEPDPDAQAELLKLNIGGH